MGYWDIIIITIIIIMPHDPRAGGIIVHVVSYVDRWPALMELILPLATCHYTFYCAILLFYYLGK